MQVRSSAFNPLGQAAADPIPQSMRGNVGNSRVRIIDTAAVTIRPTSRRDQKQDHSTLDPETLTPKDITITWKEDHNILLVNQQVLTYLKNQRLYRDSLQTKITVLENSLKPNMSVDEIYAIRIVIDGLKREIGKIENGSRLEYLNVVGPVLQEYKELSEEGPVVMGQKVKRDATLVSRKTKLVEMYFDLARKYCPMNIVRDTKNAFLCSLCNGLITDVGDHYMCIDCNTIQTKMEQGGDDSDHDDSGSKKSGYESGLNFKDLVLQFQVAYPVNIPDRILESIKGVITRYQGFSIENLTLADLVKIMKDLGLGSWYKHLNKIFLLLTGKMPKTDISKYAINIIRRGALLNEIYKDIKSEDRSNFLHGLHLLWLFLKNEGCEPVMDDFVLLKSRDVEISNLETLAKGFEILNKSHPEFTWLIFQIP